MGYGPALVGMQQGMAAFLGLTILVAGTVKLVSLDLTRRSLGRLLPRGRPTHSLLLTVLAVVLSGTETSLGVLLLAAPASALLATAVVLLCAGFVVAVARARRLGAACGCFGSFSVRAAGPTEWARALALLVLAMIMLVLVLIRPAGDPPLWTLAAGLVGAAASTLTAMAAAGPRGWWYRRLRTVLHPASAGWRPAFGWQRRRILRAARSHPAVREVCDRLPAALWWRRAQVRVQGRPARVVMVVVPGAAARVHVVMPTGGRPAVVGTTPGSVIIPGTSLPPAATVAP